MVRLYDFLPSGNGYKVRLLLSQLAIAFELVEVDILKGETRTRAFLAKAASTSRASQTSAPGWIASVTSHATSRSRNAISAEPSPQAPAAIERIPAIAIIASKNDGACTAGAMWRRPS